MSTNQRIRLGIIGSSGGSALMAANDCLSAIGKNIEWIVITDRPCGLETWAVSKGHAVHRLTYCDAESFSSEAYQIFNVAACNEILLFYTRRVASPLIDKKRVWNIHPALLPSFRGLHGVKDAMAAGVKVFGATLHRVDSGLDTGPIVAQIAAPLPARMSLAEAEHLSYLHKVWLTLVWFEHLYASDRKPDVSYVGRGGVTASPGLVDNELRAHYDAFLLRDAEVAVQPV